MNRISSSASPTSSSRLEESILQSMEGHAEEQWDLDWSLLDARPSESRGARRSLLARREAFAYIEAAPKFESQGTTILNLMQSIEVAVAHFAHATVLVSVDERFHKVEAELLVERSRVDALCEALKVGAEKKSAVDNDKIRAHVASIRDAFTGCFGSTVDILVLSPEKPGQAARVVLDATRGDASAISVARLGGARAKFYDVLIDQIPGAVLDAIEFDFVFPAS